ncbi:MAG: tRNA threonylcarbamoyladenosine dehydratase [Clostridiales bacterium]|nr:tRNA threonylcarbamoyladenosine dehydratase [Clostridiales bacterium]
MNVNDDIFSRTYGIYGPDMTRLFDAHVAVIGLGGVGGALALSLARAGVGEMTLVDGDFIVESNLNRQMIASRSALGKKKAEVTAQLIADINPDIKTHVVTEFICSENMARILKDVDYVADAIDDVRSKLDLIEYCTNRKIAIISAMGAGNKLNPCGFRVSDIAKTLNDPLSKVVRQRLRKRGINHLKVVFSEESPTSAFAKESSEEGSPASSDYTKRNPPASSPFVPSAAGLLMGSEIVKDLLS